MLIECPGFCKPKWCQNLSWAKPGLPCSVSKSHLGLCEPMDCSTPGFLVLHHLPGVCSNTCLLSQWFHSTISSSVAPLSSCPQSFPASGSFPMGWLFPSGGQRTGASASVLPMNIQDWFSLGWTGWISLQPKGLSSLLQHHSSKASILRCSAFFIVQLSHPYMTTGKAIALTRWTFVGKVMSLLFNKLPRLVITFLPRSKHLLILWLQSTSAVILEPKKISATVSTFSPSICPEVMRSDTMILIFWMLSFKPAFSLSSFTLIKRPSPARELGNWVWVKQTSQAPSLLPKVNSISFSSFLRVEIWECASTSNLLTRMIYPSLQMLLFFFSNSISKAPNHFHLLHKEIQSLLAKVNCPLSRYSIHNDNWKKSVIYINHTNNNSTDSN